MFRCRDDRMVSPDESQRWCAASALAGSLTNLSRELSNQVEKTDRRLDDAHVHLISNTLHYGFGILETVRILLYVLRGIVPEARCRRSRYPIVEAPCLSRSSPHPRRRPLALRRARRSRRSRKPSD